MSPGLIDRPIAPNFVGLNPPLSKRDIAVPILRIGRAVLLFGVALIVGALLWASLGGCAREQLAAPPEFPSQAVGQTSASCRECHEEIFQSWSGTDHALANQPVSQADLTGAFAPPREEADGGSRFHVGHGADGLPQMTARDADGRAAIYPVQAVLGHRPSRQMLVPMPGERWQPVDLAWDPAKREWFNVFADEHRHAGEWGHWTGRGMNWNSMCAHCHTTGFRKNYDATTDAFQSKWVEHGVGCIQCHGAVRPGHGRPALQPGEPPDAALAWTRDRKRAMDACAYCHARNELLTPEFSPGASYADHFRLELPVEPRAFWPDGQQRDEVFNWTSVSLSRMHHAGVTCMDCHDPHTTKTILPVANNMLCQQCHAAPGRIMPGTLVKAPEIEPLAHSRHKPESTGNQCVTCHMPTTNYMVRSPRHDHGWLKPDPLLTKELGVPNACTRCHADQSVEWAIEYANTWYGDKLASRQRTRARAVAAAQAGAAPAGLLELLATEDIAAWRATYLQLLAAWVREPAVMAAARRALHDGDPLVRASAVQLLGGDPANASELRPMLQDPVRVVRLDAAWALAPELPRHPENEREFLGYLSLSLDQPGGRYRRGQFFVNTGRFAEAEAEMRQAIAWDPNSAGFYQGHAVALQALGRPGDAGTALFRAGQLVPESGALMLEAALGYAEAGRLDEAENALRFAVQREPALDRAWYNLGLLLAQTGRRDEALSALAEAERRAPTLPDYPYAAATILWQAGEREEARAAAQRALTADPEFAPARQLLAQ